MTPKFVSGLPRLFWLFPSMNVTFWAAVQVIWGCPIVLEMTLQREYVTNYSRWPESLLVLFWILGPRLRTIRLLCTMNARSFFLTNSLLKSRFFKNSMGFSGRPFRLFGVLLFPEWQFNAYMFQYTKYCSVKFDIVVQFKTIRTLSTGHEGFFSFNYF